MPLAILEDNFFNPSSPNYLNYGAIGSIVGHEITHGFDAYNHRLDENGENKTI